GLEQIVQEMLAKSPDDRPHKMSYIARDLISMQQGSLLGAAKESRTREGTSTRTKAQGSLMPLWFTGISALAIGLAIGVAATHEFDRQKQPPPVQQASQAEAARAEFSEIEWNGERK